MYRVIKKRYPLDILNKLMVQGRDLDQLKKQRSNFNLILSGYKLSLNIKHIFTIKKCEPISDGRR